MFGKKDNPFISEMTLFMNLALRCGSRDVPCAEEIRPMIKAFFKKSMKVKVKWYGVGVCKDLGNIAVIVICLAMNTRNYEKLSSEDVASLKKIFEELDKLRAEALWHNPQWSYKSDLGNKITCIHNIVYNNMVNMHDTQEKHEDYRDGMIFQSYENLWKVIHRVNTEWNELCNRHFQLQAIEGYKRSFEFDRKIDEEKNEEKKLENFMKMLDVTKKHRHMPVCIKVVDNEFKLEKCQDI